ncbi:MAG TPA: hypothetical protein VE057_21670 [Archangium sp.]|nr:hypothetical protein [Archangium sp.]
MAALSKTESDGALKDKLNYFAKPNLLVVDEQGLDVEAAKVSGLDAGRILERAYDR